MPTTNPAVTTAWLKIAEAGEAFLVSCNFLEFVEVATTSVDSAPTVNGHQLRVGVGEQAIMRDVIGAGYVWVRLVAPKTGATLVLTK